MTEQTEQTEERRKQTEERTEFTEERTEDRVAERTVRRVEEIAEP